MNILKKTPFIMLITIILLSVYSCGDTAGSAFKGDGNIVSNEWELSGEAYKVIIEDIEFDEITGSKNALITINESGANKLTFTADKNIADSVSVSVDTSGNTVRIKGDKAKKYQFTSFDIKIETAVNDLQISGGFKADINVPSVTSFNAAANGALDAEMKFGELDSFKFICSGAGNAVISGSANDASFELSGAGEINAFDFHTVKCSVIINGAANCKIYATDTLDAEINGVGSVVYDGEPANLNQNVSGLGTIEARTN